MAFSKETGISRPSLDGYLKGTIEPGLDALEKSAAFFHVEPYTLIQAAGEQREVKPAPTVEALTKIIEDQERRLQALPAELLEIVSKLDDTRLAKLISTAGLFLNEQRLERESSAKKLK